MMGMRMVLRQTFIPMVPPEATVGLEGILMADKILKRYDAIGMLIGGVAWEIWSDHFIDIDSLSQHKDIDVIVLSRSCKKHPARWEAGIDWWISHSITERPTNGSSVNLTWNAKLQDNIYLEPGLYLCPKELLQWCVAHEEKILGDEIERSWDVSRIKPLGIHHIPAELLTLKWLNEEDECAYHCK